MQKNENEEYDSTGFWNIYKTRGVPLTPRCDGEKKDDEKPE